MIEESTKQWIKDRLIDSEFLVEFTKKDGTKRNLRIMPWKGLIRAMVGHIHLSQGISI